MFNDLKTMFEPQPKAQAWLKFVRSVEVLVGLPLKANGIKGVYDLKTARYAFDDGWSAEDYAADMLKHPLITPP